MRHIILDTDLAMGAPDRTADIDDGFALALAHSEPDITIDMVTTVNGNVDVESVTMLTLEMFERLGIDGVPVFKGAQAPIAHPEIKRTPSEALSNRFGHHRPAPGYAAAEIARHVMAHPGEITLVCIGPLTNVAAAIAIEPRLPQNVQEIVIMGGVFQGQTGTSMMPGEWNVFSDPEAAAAVARCGANLRWVGLDVTLQVRLTLDQAQEMKRSAKPFTTFAGHAAEDWIHKMSEERPGDDLAKESCAMHDPLAVAVVAHPEYVTWQPAYIQIVTGDGIARGVVVTDLLVDLEAPSPNCQIATSVQVQSFMDYFLSSVFEL